MAPLDPECDHIAGAYPFELADDLLDVLGVDVATPDDDHVLGTPADDEFTVDGVGEIAGS